MDDPETVKPIDLKLDGIKVPALGFRACVSCMWSVKENNDRVCRFNPPQSTFLALPQVVPGPGGRPQQGMAIQPFCGFPIVRDDQWCGKFERRG